MSWRSWSARVALQLSGQYEPYRLICRWLNVKRPGRCAPLGAQGVDTAYGFSYNAKIFRTTAFFPLFQHTAFYFPPSAAQMVPLSLQNGKRVVHAFHLVNRWHSHVFPPLAHQYAFLYPNKVVSTIPLSFKKGASFCKLSFS